MSDYENFWEEFSKWLEEAQKIGKNMSLEQKQERMEQLEEEVEVLKGKKIAYGATIQQLHMLLEADLETCKYTIEERMGFEEQIGWLSKKQLKIIKEMYDKNTEYHRWKDYFKTYNEELEEQ